MRTVLIIIAAILFVAAATGYALYHKKHRSVEDENFIRIDAAELFDKFTSNEINSNLKYLDKVLEVTGIISEIQTNQNKETIVILKTKDPLYGVSCTMQKEDLQITAGMQVRIKGICTGYLSDVVITKGVLTNK